MLDSATRDIVRASAPAIRLHSLAVVERMYELLFRDRSIEMIFDPSHMRDHSQPRALAEAVTAYAEHIDNIAALLPAVERIAHKHVARAVTAEHYGAVGACIIEAMGDVLGDAATPEFLTAWALAFGDLADVFIARETDLADTAAALPGGWRGLRDFRVASITEESAIIRSLDLVPVDGGTVLPHVPGQYLTLALALTDRPLLRHYSLSGAPSPTGYRISVKREPHGVGSGMIHALAPGAVLRCAVPAGHFTLDRASDRSVVLLSGGVGQTPMISMAHALAERERKPVWFLHAAIDGAAHAFADEVGAIAARALWVHTRTFYERPAAGDRLGHGFDRIGRIDRDTLREACGDGDVDVYLCGPTAFMRAMLATLAEIGVADERVHFEFFGPQSSLEATEAPSAPPPAVKLAA